MRIARGGYKMRIVSYIVTHSFNEFTPDCVEIGDMELWLDEQNIKYRTAKTSGMTGHLHRIVIKGAEDYISAKLRWV